MPRARAESSSSSVCWSMSCITSRRFSRRSGVKLSGRLSSGRRKSGRLGSWVMEKGAEGWPRELACWPGHVGQAVADEDAGGAGRGRTVFAADVGGGVGLHVEGVVMARSAILVEEDHRFGASAARAGFQQARQTQAEQTESAHLQQTPPR